ncbi:MAG TPA: Gfo/Idh/MocA family oxidoreductase [Opitutaceae bacterium]|mgnify:CR=1 FL=1|nr:Gfo/Idh/MocA family oxidoreductase [Opitutaceae bacterium]HRJ46858.1 Gfo/Idh/MocA family oxidoreductase [Opitutaceae bacterium]
MNNPINVGVVGLGRLGRLYASYFTNRLPGARLYGVTDVASEAVKATVAATGAKGFATTADLLADKAVDAIVVMTPTKLHGEIVLAAAAAGKAIFCEKPLALEISEGEAMKAAVTKHGVFFQLGFMRRFDRAYAAAKQRIDAGEIGTPVIFKSTSKDQLPPPVEYLRPASSGGLFIDMGIHDFDLARWYMGEVKEVFSVGNSVAFPEISEVGDVENGLSTLTFSNGGIGTISLSRIGIYGYGIHTEIVGTKGTIQIGYDRETAILVMTKGQIAHDTVPGFYERFEQAYISQLQNFVDNLLHDRSPPIVCDDGLKAQRIAIAATRSLHSGRAEAVI